MRASSDEWLEKRYLRSMFGCGTEWRDFNAAYEAQPEQEKERLKKVAWRMWVTLKLRYGITTHTDVRIMGWNERFQFTDVEWPSLELYLLVSCLDTLAGEPVYRNFAEWLKDQPVVCGLDTDGIANLYEQYSEEYGPRRTLRNLFTNLPPCAKEWLSENVIIQRSNRSFDPENTARDPETLVKRLFEYFYDVRRNEFTHGSSTRRTTTALNIDPDDRRWTRSLAGWEYTTDGRRYWSLYHRHGLDEATVLRGIIHTVVLQRLGIPIDHDIIRAYVITHSRLSALHGFVNEAIDNARALSSWWAKFDEHGSGNFYTYLAHAGIPRLRSEWSPILVDRFITDYPLERGLRQWVVQYLEAVNQLNSAIADFNDARPPSPSTQEGWGEYMRLTKSFFEDQAKTQAYDFVLRAPHQSQMDNIRIIIRNPSYS